MGFSLYGNLYGFMRDISYAALLAGIIGLVMAFSLHSPPISKYATGATLVAGVVLFFASQIMFQRMFKNCVVNKSLFRVPSDHRPPAWNTFAGRFGWVAMSPLGFNAESTRKNCG